MFKTYKRRRLKKPDRSREEDRLSNLPDDLLCRILSELPTKDTIRTRLLSKRWTNLWLTVPALDLDSKNFEHDAFLFDFIDEFVESSEEERGDIIKRFKLVYDAFDHIHSDFVQRMDGVVKRRVCHLTVLNRVDGEEALVRMPLSLYSCGTLVDLTLYNVVFDRPENELVSLPCLNTMHLEAVKFDGNDILKRLISSCSVLEKLVVITHPGDYLEVVSVRSKSLKSFKLESMRETFEDHGLDPRVEIDSPSLEYLCVTDYKPRSFCIYNISPCAKVDVDVVFDVEFDDDDPLNRTRVHNFLRGLSTVREIVISARTLKVIKVFSQFEPLPQFSNLSRLDASFVESTLEVLPTFLGCCPNLQSLVMDFDCLPKTDNEIKLSYVPQCFISSLEFVLMMTPITVTEPSLQMNLAKYFVRNCGVLKTLMVSESFSSIIKKIERIPKRSGGCEVVMLNPCVVVHQTSSLY
ncbi:F-box/FBD/LRR-repeat protein At1g80470-like [Raphanus sativus]|uniref:F-box/FBD/LRR-repeat protein At1g80470-like n=1 Tax=Raphanus sativus TaxID=3726 RepID=A0A6J0L3G3_RAPSA|nr:F-box/FBD/LRR-repeat protein At1g80470-like [Raphanus sativus]